MLLSLSIGLMGCGKKEKIPVPALKNKMKAVPESIGEAAVGFKAEADAKALKIGEAVKNFGTEIGGVFKKDEADSGN